MRLILAAVIAASLLPATAREPSPMNAQAFSVRSVDEQNLPPPVKEKVRARSALISQQNVIPVTDHRLPDFAATEAQYRGAVRTLSQLVAQKAITFSPANVDATSLQGQTMFGAMTHGVLANHSWTGLSRMFDHPHLGRVVLEETDLASAGGGVVFTREMINADVNGAPAVLLREQAGDASAMTSSNWYANGILYLLSTPTVDDKARDELLDIARHLRP